MTLASGTRLGRYEIRSKIGEGGMGEVYLARDPQLERTIALKILPAGVASDSERMRRFVQEARAEKLELPPGAMAEPHLAARTSGRPACTARSNPHHQAL